MSAWGLIISPLAAATQLAAAEPAATPAAQDSADIFSEFTAMDENAMGAASGGSHTAIDIGHIASNIAENDGDVNDVSVNNSNTGKIQDINVLKNDGITTVFNNTGNGVVMQSNVNVNVFLDGGMN